MRSVTTQVTSSMIPVKHWDSYDTDQDCTHRISVVDQLASNGQVYLDIDSINDPSGVTGALGVIAEINKWSSEQGSTPCIHFSVDGNSLFLAFYENGNVLLRPESGVVFDFEMRQVKNGEHTHDEKFCVVR